MHKVPPGHFNLQCRCGIASWMRMQRRHHRHGDVGQQFWWQFRPRSGSLCAMQWRFTLPPWIKPYIIEDRRVDCGRRIRSKASERIFQHGRKAHWSFQMPELRALPWRHAWTVCRWTRSDFDSLCRLSSGDIMEWWWVCCLLWWCRCHVVPLARWCHVSFRIHFFLMAEWIPKLIFWYIGDLRCHKDSDRRATQVFCLLLVLSWSDHCLLCDEPKDSRHSNTSGSDGDDCWHHWMPMSIHCNCRVDHGHVARGVQSYCWSVSGALAWPRGFCHHMLRQCTYITALHWDHFAFPCRGSLVTPLLPHDFMVAMASQVMQDQTKAIMGQDNERHWAFFARGLWYHERVGVEASDVLWASEWGTKPAETRRGLLQ